jgi:hypothetical protein
MQRGFGAAMQSVQTCATAATASASVRAARTAGTESGPMPYPNHQLDRQIGPRMRGDDLLQVGVHALQQAQPFGIVTGRSRLIPGQHRFDEKGVGLAVVVGKGRTGPRSKRKQNEDGPYQGLTVNTHQKNLDHNNMGMLKPRVASVKSAKPQPLFLCQCQKVLQHRLIPDRSIARASAARRSAPCPKAPRTRARATQYG